ncbi:MAG: bifunctional folylpolyglutamate synthase/dihydrofolate synthase, partial [Cyclobacteriaceae bacterium]|nr:bifunctional folylpolyglutamate synthase/dihydrofolate synthase [Cyclobacteriaceae bacterium]
KDTLEYMYALLPMYQRVGKIAFKKDLTNILKLCETLGNPQDTFKSIHIAGTNGKGSSAHMIASILQSAGYKTGLYTSPHLKSFTERIKINGQEIEEQFVCDFIEKIKTDIEEIRPSFFEITVAMAFECFSKQNVDVAVMEVGLGGRFDSTNVIMPTVSLITSIGLDHTDMLGETLPEIAFEKAGIIKRNIPVVISETQHEITRVFKKKANEMKAPLYFADQEYVVSVNQNSSIDLEFTAKTNTNSFTATTDLAGEYQLKNIPGVMKVLGLLNVQGFHISDEQMRKGFSHVVENTGLLGRWQKLADNPLTICDTVHNELGIKSLIRQIEKIQYDKLYIIWGTVEGKDLHGVFQHLPSDAFYYFCEASIPRALQASTLQNEVSKYGLTGSVEKDVNTAIEKAREKAGQNDLVFIGGSNFLIAEIKGLN